MTKLLLTILFVGLLATASAQLRGVNYGIQKPDGSCTGPADVLADFQIIATYAQAVKIYNLGYCNGAANSLAAAQATGLKVFLGMPAAPDSAYQNEKNVLRSVAGQYTLNNVLGITVGSEDLYRQSVAAQTIANQISEVKQIVASLGYSTPVTHVDVYYLQPAEILAVADIVMFNAFPFWEGVDISGALAAMQSHYQQVTSVAGGKTVWIGETGWPANGATQGGAAVPSPQNQQAWLNTFVCWANSAGIPYFWFEAFDEPWKQPDPNGDIEVSFGLYTSDRVKKSSFSLSCAGPATPTPTSSQNVATPPTTQNVAQPEPTTQNVATPPTTQNVAEPVPTQSPNGNPAASTGDNTPAQTQASQVTPANPATSPATPATSGASAGTTSGANAGNTQANTGAVAATQSPSTSGNAATTSGNQAPATVVRQQGGASSFALSSVLVAAVLAICL